jgi:hypothetical protein
MPERRCRGLHREAPAEQGRAAPQELLPREAEGLLAVRNRDQEEAAAGPGPRRCGRRVAVREESALHRSRHGTFLLPCSIIESLHKGGQIIHAVLIGVACFCSFYFRCCILQASSCRTTSRSS